MCSENFPEMYRQTNDWMCLWAWMLIVYVCVELSGRTSLLTLINSSTLLKHPPLFNSIHTFTSNTDTIASGQFDSMFNSGISLFFLLFCSVDSLCTNRLHEPKWIIYSKRSWQPKHTTTFSQKKKTAHRQPNVLYYFIIVIVVCVCVLAIWRDDDGGESTEKFPKNIFGFEPQWRHIMNEILKSCSYNAVFSAHIRRPTLHAPWTPIVISTEKLLQQDLHTRRPVGCIQCESFVSELCNCTFIASKTGWIRHFQNGKLQNERIVIVSAYDFRLNVLLALEVDESRRFVSPSNFRAGAELPMRLRKQGNDACSSRWRTFVDSVWFAKNSWYKLIHKKHKP